MVASAVAALVADAVDIQCLFDEHDLEWFETVNICRATVASLESSTLKSVTGCEPTGSCDEITLEKVDGLYVKEQDLQFFPEGTTMWFKNLRVLSYEDNNMDSISAADFAPFSKLEYLRLDGNSFTSLDGDLFTHTPHLKFIALERNEILYIGPGFVTSLEDLEYLHLRENTCISQAAFGRETVITLSGMLSVLLCVPETSSTAEETTTTVEETTTTTIATTTELQTGLCECKKQSSPTVKVRKCIRGTIG